jgi:DNA-binding CsgD family transcriptional regulator
MITNNPARLGTPDEDGEREVLRLAGELLSTDEIAGTLFISVTTVKSHLKSIFRKLGSADRRDTVRRAGKQECSKRTLPGPVTRRGHPHQVTLTIKQHVPASPEAGASGHHHAGGPDHRRLPADRHAPASPIGTLTARPWGQPVLGRALRPARRSGVPGRELGSAGQDAPARPA